MLGAVVSNVKESKLKNLCEKDNASKCEGTDLKRLKLI